MNSRFILPLAFLSILSLFILAVTNTGCEWLDDQADPETTLESSRAAVAWAVEVGSSMRKVTPLADGSFFVCSATVYNVVTSEGELLYSSNQAMPVTIDRLSDAFGMSDGTILLAGNYTEDDYPVDGGRIFRINLDGSIITEIDIPPRLVEYEDWYGYKYCSGFKLDELPDGSTPAILYYESIWEVNPEYVNRVYYAEIACEEDTLGNFISAGGNWTAFFDCSDTGEKWAVTYYVGDGSYGYDVRIVGSDYRFHFGNNTKVFFDATSAGTLVIHNVSYSTDWVTVLDKSGTEISHFGDSEAGETAVKRGGITAAGVPWVVIFRGGGVHFALFDGNDRFKDEVYLGASMNIRSSCHTDDSVLLLTDGGYLYRITL